MALPASDTFNRADENPLSNGAKWTTTTSRAAPQVVTNQLEPSSTADASAFWNADSFPNDQQASVKVVTVNTNTTQGVGVVLRCASATADFYRCLVRGPLGAAAATLSIKKVVGGTTTTLSETAGFTVNSGDTLKSDAVGTTITIYINGTSQTTVTDSALTAGAAGVYLFANPTITDVILDNWTGDAATAIVSQIILSRSRPFPYAPGAPNRR